MGGNGASRIHHILAADLSIAVDILAPREKVEAEGQIDEVLLCWGFQLGDADEELIVFWVVEALHPYDEVLQLVQNGEVVFPHEEVLRPANLVTKADCGASLSSIAWISASFAYSSFSLMEN